MPGFCSDLSTELLSWESQASGADVGLPRSQAHHSTKLLCSTMLLVGMQADSLHRQLGGDVPDSRMALGFWQWALLAYGGYVSKTLLPRLQCKIL